MECRPTAQHKVMNVYQQFDLQPFNRHRLERKRVIDAEGLMGRNTGWDEGELLVREKDRNE